jgi:hypothetical protein
MAVTNQEVREIISDLFTIEPLIKDEFIGFYLAGNHHIAEVVVSLFTSKSFGDGAPLRQGVQTWLWFNNSDKFRMNLATFSFAEILELRHKLQSELDWCELIPAQVDENTIEISLYRAFDITMDDIELAHDNDFDSSLLRNLVRLCDDWELLSPIFSGIATEQITSLTGVEMFLQGTEGTG